MRSLLIAAALTATSAAAQEVDLTWAEGSNARSWGLFGEAPATFSGTIVDVLCEVTGDCTDNCGDGARQLGIVRADDGVLLYLQKNDQGVFTGAVRDALPYCGQEVEVDGLTVTDELLGAVNIYQLQFIRPIGAEEWVRANQWTDLWEADHPEWAGEGRWYRRDQNIRALLDTEGYFGLGIDRDAEIMAELFQ